MEAVGINVGYLLIQILCFVLIGLAIVFLAIFIISKLGKSEKNRMFLVSLPVTADGVFVPQQYFEQQSAVKLYKSGNEIIITPMDS